jgi:hypothetical protein
MGIKFSPSVLIHIIFLKIHKSLHVPPAMETGLIKRLISIEDIVKLTD